MATQYSLERARIPNELSDLVVSFLSGDIVTLQSMCMAGLRFVQPCQRLLFRELKLDALDPDRQWDCISTLCTVLTESPHLCSFIRAATIPGWFFRHTDLVTLLQSLQSLSRLEIIRGKWNELPASVVEAILTCVAPNVETLKLYNMHVDTPVDILFNFRRLRRIELIHTSFSMDVVPSSMDIDFVTVKELDCNEGVLRRSLTPLAHALQNCSLESVHLTYSRAALPPNYLTSVVQLMSHHQQTLVCLDIKYCAKIFFDPSICPMDMHPFTIQNLPALEFLEMALPVQREDFLRNPTLAWLVGNLRGAIASPRPLSTLCLRVFFLRNTVPYLSKPELSDWASLDAAFESPGLDALAEVRLDCYLGSTQFPIADLLPRTTASGRGFNGSISMDEWYSIRESRSLKGHAIEAAPM
ncbi:hypothetical protein DL96DRAFT_1583450 [Flagelloscypha sp. PMI_526]|nr:hypothetical protein DL96DRAFT_1583450 [Flagelloscypha sp. PMI_526]